jgi:ribonuclease Z
MGRVVVLLIGEGTQRQMVAAHIGFSRVKLIFITHLHGDHVLGVPGLLQSMTLQRREEPLAVYGPRGLHAFLQEYQAHFGGPGSRLGPRDMSPESSTRVRVQRRGAEVGA